MPHWLAPYQPCDEHEGRGLWSQLGHNLPQGLDSCDWRVPSSSRRHEVPEWLARHHSRDELGSHRERGASLWDMSQLMHARTRGRWCW